MAAPFTMPKAREYGWHLKSTSSTEFEIVERANGQFCVVLNHSLLRGVTSEMIAWWFQNFGNLRVRLDDTPGYENQSVPAYLLWHPSDHCNAEFEGQLGPGGVAKAGARIVIQEAMQYENYGMEFPVSSALDIFYCEKDGWAMGKSLPLLGKVMCLRIHYKDVMNNGEVIGVHYHYEIVIGLSGDNLIARTINRKITADYSPKFFSAWHLHNTIEVGTFENFLPGLYQQRNNPSSLHFALEMDNARGLTEKQGAYDPELFKQRVEGYKNALDPHAFQGAKARTYL